MEPFPEDELRKEYDLNTLPRGVRGKFTNRHTFAQINQDSGYEKTASFPSFLAQEDLEANVNSFLKHIDIEMQPILLRSVLPIFCYKGSAAAVCGTGTLFRTGSKSFLITASHVITHADRKGFGLGITDCIAGAKLIALHGTVHGNELEEMDFAIWDLPAEVVAQLPNRTFLSIHQTVRDTRLGTNATFMIHGYPSEFGKYTPVGSSAISANVSPLTIFTGHYSGDARPLIGYLSEHHLLLETAKGAGEPIRNPEMAPPSKVAGMSGCTVWQVYYEGFNANHWTANDAVVVGIQTGVYSSGNVTKVTRWHHIYQLLYRRYPELHGPLSLIVS